MVVEAGQLPDLHQTEAAWISRQQGQATNPLTYGEVMNKKNYDAEERRHKKKIDRENKHHERMHEQELRQAIRDEDKKIKAKLKKHKKKK